jgi:hypothetical protein
VRQPKGSTSMNANSTAAPKKPEPPTALIKPIAQPRCCAAISSAAITNAVADAVTMHMRANIWKPMNQVMWVLTPAHSVPRLMPMTDARKRRRRPMRSARGSRKKAGIAPSRTSPMVRPISRSGSPKSAAICLIAWVSSP